MATPCMRCRLPCRDSLHDNDIVCPRFMPGNPDARDAECAHRGAEIDRHERMLNDPHPEHTCLGCGYPTRAPRNADEKTCPRWASGEFAVWNEAADRCFAIGRARGLHTIASNTAQVGKDVRDALASLSARSGDQPLVIDTGTGHVELPRPPITRLEYFAAAALNGLVVPGGGTSMAPAVVSNAWKFAEAMEAEAMRREQPPAPPREFEPGSICDGCRDKQAVGNHHPRSACVNPSTCLCVRHPPPGAQAFEPA